MTIPRLADKDECIPCSICKERSIFVDQLNPADTELNRCHRHMTNSMTKRVVRFEIVPETIDPEMADELRQHETCVREYAELSVRCGKAEAENKLLRAEIKRLESR